MPLESISFYLNYKNKFNFEDLRSIRLDPNDVTEVCFPFIVYAFRVVKSIFKFSFSHVRSSFRLHRGNSRTTSHFLDPKWKGDGET